MRPQHLPLHGGERVGILPCEEVLRGDHGPREGRYALPALAKVQTGGGILRRAKNGDVRVGGDLQAGEATSCVTLGSADAMQSLADDPPMTKVHPTKPPYLA